MAENPRLSWDGGQIRRETDCLLEGTGFEISVPRYLWWSRGSPRYAIRAEQRVVSESVSPRCRRERIRTPVDRLRVQGFVACLPAPKSWHSAESTHPAREQRDRRRRHGVAKLALDQRSVPRQRKAGLSPQGARSPVTRYHLAPPTNSPDRFPAGRSSAPSGSSRTRSHDAASAPRPRS